MSELFERCPVLRDMVTTRQTYTEAGERVGLQDEIYPPYAEALYEMIRRANPSVVLEVGMAFGVSSLAILSALRDGDRNGKLISIDPFQTASRYKGCGSAAIARAGLSGQHELIEDYDYNALPRLMASNTEIDFAYIDGWHTFDYTLLDWWYVDKMLTVDGIVAFNDCQFRAVKKVIRFILTHRKYAEIDPGHVRFGGYGWKRELLRRLTFGHIEHMFRMLRGRDDRYFKKLADWEPDWFFFARF
jgi:predicted O-methyltransferase YrrM